MTDETSQSHHSGFREPWRNRSSTELRRWNGRNLSWGVMFVTVHRRVLRAYRDSGKPVVCFSILWLFIVRTDYYPEGGNVSFGLWPLLVQKENFQSCSDMKETPWSETRMGVVNIRRWWLVCNNSYFSMARDPWNLCLTTQTVEWLLWAHQF